MTAQEHQEIQNSNPDNRFLQGYGMAGYHDIKLGKDTIEGLLWCDSPDKSVMIPQFDQTLDNNRGDRVPIDDYKKVQGPIDLVIF